jgi:hypothetical protein
LVGWEIMWSENHYENHYELVVVSTKELDDLLMTKYKEIKLTQSLNTKIRFLFYLSRISQLKEIKNSIVQDPSISLSEFKSLFKDIKDELEIIYQRQNQEIPWNIWIIGGIVFVVFAIVGEKILQTNKKNDQN